jgi:hypothetical protein
MGESSRAIMNRVRDMEKRSVKVSEIDAEYERYWQAVDRERLESQKACREIEAHNAEMAARKRLTR